MSLPDLPPGCTLAQVSGPDECTHQYPDGADAFELVNIQAGAEGYDLANFVCDLCGDTQQRKVAHED